MKSIATISILWAGLCLCLAPEAIAKIKKPWISVPVYFATTRALDEGHKYTGGRNESQKDQGVEYGIVTVTIQTESETDLDKPSMVKLGWREATKRERKSTKIAPLSRDDFYRSLIGRHQSTVFKETCIFIHGYNNKFEAAAGSAARLEVALREPVVLFSWPSKGKLRSYTVDECNAEWSLRPFQVFMQGIEEELDDKGTEGSEHLFTVSHSMGNRLINWLFQSRYDKANQKPSKFSEVVLTSPDIDRATFKNYFYKVAENGQKTRIYVSRKDMPLRLSKFVHGSARVGSEKFQNESNWQMPGNIEGTETINFTEVDSSKIGHSIQYKIIANMHRASAPGAGLDLIPDTAYKGQYFRIQEIKP